MVRTVDKILSKIKILPVAKDEAFRSFFSVLLSSKIMIFCRILISYAEFHANVLKTDFSKGNKTSFFLFSQIAQVKKVNRLQISQKSKNKTKISLKKLSYRIKSTSLSLCVMKLFSSRVFTLTKAAPYP